MTTNANAGLVKSLKYLQEAATILAPQNRIKGRCEIQLDNWIAKEREEKSVKSRV